MTKRRRELGTTSTKSNAAVDASEIRQRVAAMMAELEGGDAVLSLVDALVSERDALSTKCEALSAEYERQELRIKQLVHLVYGRKTEKLTKEELAQLALAFGATEEEASQEEPAVPHPEPPQDEEAEPKSRESGGKPKKKKKRKRRAKTVVGAEVERVVHEVTVPANERGCACCDEEMAVIGQVEHETLEFVPAKFVVHVERREKLACRNSQCRCDIHTAERAFEPPVRRKVDISLLAQLVEGKCEDALPVDRQRDQFKRLGVTFPLNTLYSYWTYVTALLLPVATVTLARVLGDDYLRLDDTKLRVLDKQRSAGSYKGCLWCFTSGAHPLVAYSFTESWEAEAIGPTIATIDGFIQCDDYKGYSSVVKLPDGSERVLVDPGRRLGCMMHVRRRFHDALKLGDTRAGPAIQWIHDLYEIEAEAKAQGLDPVGRLALRTERSLPLLDDFERWVDDMQPKCVPKSPLAKALGYAKNQRVFVRRCFSDGRFEIDNGDTERALRRPCIGRNNYLFTGSPEAAKRLAGAYTLVQSCRAVGVQPRVYLIDVIAKLEADWPLRRIGELVPDQWAVLHGPGALGQQSAQ